MQTSRAGDPAPRVLPVTGVDLSPRFGPFRAAVSAEDIRAYAQATDDPDPEAQAGVLASPLFSASLVMPAYSRSHHASVPEPLPGTRATAHAAHDLRLHRPIVAGDKVSWKTRVLTARQTPAGVVVVHRIEVSDAGDGAPVLEQLWSAIHVGATLEGVAPDATPQPAVGARPAGAPAVPDPTTGNASTGEPGTPGAVEAVLDVPADLAQRYASVSGGLIHRAGDGALDPQAAPAAADADGGPVFLQGLCTLAAVTNLVLQRAGVADRRRVRRIAARFSRPVFAGSTLLVTLAEGNGVIAFVAREPDGRPAVKGGRIELSSA